MKDLGLPWRISSSDPTVVVNRDGFLVAACSDAAFARFIVDNAHGYHEVALRTERFRSHSPDHNPRALI